MPNYRKPVSQKYRVISMSMNPELLRRLDSSCKKSGKARSVLIAEFVERMLGTGGVE